MHMRLPMTSWGLLGPPRELWELLEPYSTEIELNPTEIHPNPIEIKTKSNQNQIESKSKSNQNQNRIKPKSSQNPNQIKSKSKSNRIKIKSKSNRNPAEIQPKILRKSSGTQKSQEIMWNPDKNPVEGCPPSLAPLRSARLGARVQEEASLEPNACKPSLPGVLAGTPGAALRARHSRLCTPWKLLGIIMNS